MEKKKIAVVGGGMAGPLLSILLAKHGYAVTLMEMRKLSHLREGEKGRSFSLTLSKRGLSAIRKVGLEAQFLSIAQPLSSRMTHLPRNLTTVMPYSSDPSSVLHAVRRSDLNSLLVEAALATDGVTFKDQIEFLDYRSETRELVFKDESQNIQTELFDYVIGADGVNSKVRDAVHRRRPGDFHREYFSMAYREFGITAEAAQKLKLNLNSLHVWPASGAMLIAIPNRDGSYTGDVLLPREGDKSLESMTSPEKWETFITDHFGRLAEQIPDLRGEVLLNRRNGLLQSTSTNVWWDQGRMLIIGDAAHGVFPFYGQGLNCALEDCLILEQCLDKNEGDFERAFAAFEKERKPDADALRELSYQHFWNLQNYGQGAELSLKESLMKKAIYELVAHSNRPYREAIQMSQALA